MKLKSLILHHQRLQLAEIEIELMPGIPQIHFLGLPDRLIKESFYRIKSALKNSGYQFPRGQQIIVNIKPSHLQKSSRGLELAVALGILLITNQISEEKISTKQIMYGELGLNGEVYQPNDLIQQLYQFKDDEILTGQAFQKQIFANLYELDNLRDLNISSMVTKNKPLIENEFIRRPQFGLDLTFDESEAELIFLTITTGLHLMLAGASGQGKTTLAKALPSFKVQPDDLVRVDELGWYPIVNVHSRMSLAALIGGGVQLYSGEIERARGGMLIMDEFLEFSSEVLETLRSPMTGEILRLSRGAGVRLIHPDFQVIATTNLCPCGQWTPIQSQKYKGCRFSRTKCVRYLEKLSGPVLDRFGLLYFTTEQTKKRTITADRIIKRIESVNDILKKSSVDFIEDEGLVQSYYADISGRRRKYLDRAALIYAIERLKNQSTKVDMPEIKSVFRELQDYTKAEKWVLTSFQQIQKGIS